MVRYLVGPIRALMLGSAIVFSADRRHEMRLLPVLATKGTEPNAYARDDRHSPTPTCPAKMQHYSGNRGGERSPRFAGSFAASVIITFLGGRSEPRLSQCPDIRSQSKNEPLLSDCAKRIRDTRWACSRNAWHCRPDIVRCRCRLISDWLNRLSG